MGAVLSTWAKKKVLTSRKSRKLKRILLKMLLIATIAPFTCLTVANPHHRTARSCSGSAAICSSAEKAYSSAKQGGKSEDVAGAVAAKLLYTNVFEVFDGSIECGSSVDAINGMADYFNEFGKSVITTICKKATVAFLDAKISGASKVDALKAAATTYTDYIADYPDPDSACFKSQDSL